MIQILDVYQAWGNDRHNVSPDAEHPYHLRTVSGEKPVLLFDMQENRIYVYPYLEFKNDLSERSQRSLQEQYEQAMTDDKIVVFVRDNDAKKLVSYSV